MLATNFGLISTIDGGVSWSWICESDTTSNGYLYQVGPPPNDRLFALSGDGKLAHSDDGACTWRTAQGAVASGSVVDAFADPNDPQRVLAIVSPDGRVGSQTAYTLVVAHDGGSSFDLLFTAAKSQVLTGVEVARQDANIIYSTASTAPNFTPQLIRSSDRGASWQTIDLGAVLEASDIRLIGIDPEHDDKLFLRATTPMGEGLTITDDAGATVRSPVVLPAGRLTAFARLSAGPLLAAGEIDKEAFLYRSVDAGITFTRVAGAPHLRALAEREGVLLGATDNALDGFALASSTDQGDTWRPSMRFDQVNEIAACVKTSCRVGCVTEANLMLWPAAICGPDAVQSSLADASLPDGSTDEGPGVVASGASGCSCRVGLARRAGFVHDSIPAAAAAISKSATAAGLAPEQSKDPGKFVPAQLSQYAAIVLLATSGDAFGTPGTTQIQTLIDFVRAGGGLVAIEDANHGYDNSVPYISLIGGDFNGHSAFGPDTCYKDGNHPSVAMLPASFAVTDEIYYFTKFGADNQIVLRCGADKRPISWVRTEGAGRVFYTALVHADASWTNPPLVDGHVIPALLWTLGR